MSFIKDDMIFEPYMNNGFQCKMEISVGVISVRFGGHGLITRSGKPYEVWYPTDSAPIGDQTAEDIWNYIKQHSKSLVNEY
jgi:hypothetical protein